MGTPANIDASHPPVGASISETFDNSDLSGWELLSGATVADGALRLPTGGSAVYGVDLADFTLAVRARFTSGQGELRISYRDTGAGAYRALVGSAHTVLAYDGSPPLAGVEFSPVESWFEIGITAQGEKHTISIDGKPVLSASDARHLSEGSIVFDVVDKGLVVELDDFRLAGAGQPALSQQQASTVPTPDRSQIPTGSGIPAYEADTWVKLGGPPGGLGYDIRMRPDNPDVMYVTDARAGIFKSIDGGATWHETNGNLIFGPDAVAPIFCATIDPHNYDVVWIGTQITGHLYRSEDGGQSWQVRDEGIVHDGRSLRGITIDPNDAKVVYVGLEVEAGMWQREHPEASADVVGGEVYKSTDAGTTWTRIWQGSNLARYVWIDPRNSNRVYVSTGIFDRIPANSNRTTNDAGGIGILRSDDAGQTWTVLDERNGLGGRIIPSLFMDPANPDILLAAVYAGGSAHGGVYVTRDGGDTWEKSLDYPMGIHNVEIAVSDPNIWYSATENAVFRSDDAGQTWQKYVLATPDRAAGMPIDLQVDPRDPYRIFVNNYGGSNFMSTDGGATWVDASKGYTGASAVVSMLPDGSVLAEANTAIFHSVDGGFNWVGLTYVEGATLADGGPDHVLLASGGGVLHSIDGGTTWSPAEVIDVRAEAEAGRIQGDVLASRLAVASSDPHTVYFGFHEGLCGIGVIDCFKPMPGFFRSHDGGYTWKAVPGTPFESASIMQIVVHPQDSRKLYVAAGGGLYLSNDGGDNWQQAMSLNEVVAQVAIWDADIASGQGDKMVIIDVALDPFDPNILYAAALHKGVFRSTDGGATWQTATYGMDPNEPVMTLVFDPNRAGVIYAGSKWSGVFVSTDGAQTWRKITNGLTNTSVISLALSGDGSILYAGTFNAGAWRLGPP